MRINKPNLTLAKVHQAFLTNDGYILSGYFCDPLRRVREYNKALEG